MLKIRLSRVGRKKQPFFKIVVIPKSAPPKGGRFRDQVGTHDPVNKETIIDHEKARAWIAKGAQPSGTVHNLFIKHGVITGRKVEVHDKDPIEAKPDKEAEDKKKESEEKAEKIDKKETEKSEEEKEEKSEKAEKEKDAKEEPEKKDNTKKEVKEENKKEEEKPKENKKEEKEEKKELDSLNLTTRITNALKDAGIDTVEKLRKKSKEELAEIDGLGEKSIEKIIEELK